MPIHIDRVVNEISPESGANSDSEQADTRWRQRREVQAIRDEQEYLAQRVAADEFDD